MLSTPGSYVGRVVVIVTETVRTALVGGGGTGIGRASAQRLAAAGHRVVLAGRREEVLLRTAAEVATATGGDVRTAVVDLADPDDASSVLATVEAGIGPVDVVIANAGGPPPGRVLAAADDAWYAATELLLLGPLRLARAALPRMAERGFGRFVIITSTAVRRPEPDLALSVVLRSALTAAAKLLSLEFADRGVTVNCVAPGATATARHDEIVASRAGATGVAAGQLLAEEARGIPAARAGEPEEVAAAVAFLASAAASYVNGTVLTVDGGRTESIW